MKYVLVIGDGMADAPLEQLAGKTPLEALALPAFDRVASGRMGRVRTVPEGLPPGSDTAILSIFGNDPRRCYTGRSVLEAAGMGVPVRPGEVSFRVNLCAVTEPDGRPAIQSHNGGSIHGAEAEALMAALLGDAEFAALLERIGLTLHPTDTFRHIGVLRCAESDLSALRCTEPHNVLGQPVGDHWPQALPGANEAVRRIAADVRAVMETSYRLLRAHPVNRAREAEGKLPANMLWPWGAATAMTLPDFAAKYGHGGSVVSAVPLVWGIATLMGLRTPRVPGANGDLDTNYAGKVEAALAALRAGDDFAAVHVEAPDEMAHAGDLGRKLEAIQNVEYQVVAPLLAGLDAAGEPYRLLLLSDHPTLLTTRTHDGAPVPYALYDSRRPAEPPQKFCERAARGLPLEEDGTRLMRLLFEQAEERKEVAP